VHELLAEPAVQDLGLPESARRWLWPVVYVPVAIVAVAGLVAAVRRSSERARSYMFVGIGFLFVAVASEVMSAFLDSETIDVIQVAVEESTELAGWILVAASLAATHHLVLAGRDSVEAVATSPRVSELTTISDSAQAAVDEAAS
jgi:uncharacterized membrane protein